MIDHVLFGTGPLQGVGHSVECALSAVRFADSMQTIFDLQRPNLVRFADQFGRRYAAAFGSNEH